MYLTQPLLSNLAAAWLGALVVLTVTRLDWSVESSTKGFLVPALGIFGFALGLAYTQLAEYLIHRFPMHRRLGRFGILAVVRRNHVRHHRLFYGERFRSADRDRLRYAVGTWYGFPALLVLHWFWFRLVLPTDVLTGFLLGAVLHYTVFEIIHYATHAEGFWLERWLPAPLRASWERAIENHRRHHLVPTVAFNVTPPFLGDRVQGTIRRLFPWLLGEWASLTGERGVSLRGIHPLRRASATLLLTLAAWTHAHPHQEHQEPREQQGQERPEGEAAPELEWSGADVSQSSSKPRLE